MNIALRIEDNGIILVNEGPANDVPRTQIKVTDGISVTNIPAMDLRESLHGALSLSDVEMALVEAGYKLKPVAH